MHSTRPRKHQPTINPCWTNLTEGWIHVGIRRMVVSVGTVSATNPFTTVLLSCVISVALLVIGYSTNFVLELNQLHFVTPSGSLPDLHSQWIENEEGSPASGFPKTRAYYLNIHNDGNNVINAHAMEVAIEAIEVVQRTKNYDKLCLTCDECSESDKKMMFDGNSYCRLNSVTQFWDHSSERFRENLTAAISSNNNSSNNNNMTADEYVRQAVSYPTYPDGTPVYHEAILGKFEGYNTTTGDDIDYLTVPPLSLAKLLEVYTNDNDNSTQEMYLTSAECLTIKLDVPDVGSATDDFEEDVLERLADLQDKYESSETIQVEYFTMNGYQYEMMRALYTDMPLVGVLVVIMVAFAVLVFSDRHDRVQSRGIVGIYSFTTIGLSLFAGYGFMWLIGVPITSVATLIPFVVSGVGLDDTFIITGTYFRLRREEAESETQSIDTDNTDTTISSQQQKWNTTLRLVQATLNEVAVSITMTTITTLLAFMFGATSQVPAVRWLCWYAAISLFFVYVLQITCFISLLVLDERRVQANRKDLCIWIVVKEEAVEVEEDGDKQVENDLQENGSSSLQQVNDAIEDVHGEHPPEKYPSRDQRIDDESSGEVLKSPVTSSPKLQPPKHSDRSFSERLMGWYANQLLKPVSKVIVVLAFLVYLGGTLYSTTLLRQEFNIEDYIPEDSYMTTSMRAFEDYSTFLLYIECYFRNVDQADPEIQDQMLSYVQEMSHLEQIGHEPGFFWLRDFRQLVESNQTEDIIGIDLETFSFNEQVNLALSIPQLRQIYGRDIVRDLESGNITASRTFTFVREFDMYNIPEQVDFLLEQRDISLRQPANDKSKRIPGEGLNFFTFADLYFYWELFATVIDELILNTILCVVVISVVTFVLVPHWSAVFYSCPLLIMLYFNLMGTMQYCGITINVISYFILVMSIGLLVDFLMHILLRYYESKGTTRDEKVKKTLETIGASILMGAFTTFLGVIPLAFSTTKVFKMVFICFIAMVTLGVAAGLVFLPVLLSLTGPVGDVQDEITKSEADRGTNEESSDDHKLPERIVEESEWDEEISL